MGTNRQDPAFSLLADVIGAEPVFMTESKWELWYFFEGHGLHVHFLKEPNCFGSAHFLNGKGIHEYNGDLPNEIRWNDGADIVEKKLGLITHVSRFSKTPTPDHDPTLIEEYDTPEVHLQFSFDSAGLYSLWIHHRSAYTIEGYATDYEISTVDSVLTNRARLEGEGSDAAN